MYEYNNPVDNGFTKVKLSRKNHNILFPKRKIKFFQKYDYYLKNNWFKMERYINIIGIIMFTILLPFFLLINIVNIKDTLKEYKRTLFQKKYGSFVSDDALSEKKIIEIKKYLKG